MIRNAIVRNVEVNEAYEYESKMLTNSCARILIIKIISKQRALWVCNEVIKCNIYFVANACGAVKNINTTKTRLLSMNLKLCKQ